VVAAIWGVIIVKIIGGFSQDDVVLPSQVRYTAKPLVEQVKYDTIDLVLDYTDPFLKKKYKVVKHVVKKNIIPKTTVKVAPKIVQRVYWPQIAYDGVIQSKGNTLAMLRINKQSYILKLGAQEKEVTILSVHADSILLSYKDEEKYYYKN